MNERSKIEHPLGQKVIICPARLSQVKGIHVLLPALARLQKVRADFVWWIVGDGEMRILLATYWLNPHLGGVWNYMVTLKRKLESLGHEVDIFGNNEDFTVFHMPFSSD